MKRRSRRFENRGLGPEAIHSFSQLDFIDLAVRLIFGTTSLNESLFHRVQPTFEHRFPLHWTSSSNLSRFMARRKISAAARRPQRLNIKKRSFQDQKTVRTNQITATVACDMPNEPFPSPHPADGKVRYGVAIPVLLLLCEWEKVARAVCLRRMPDR
jgi:hypothetical protein